MELYRQREDAIIINNELAMEVMKEKKDQNSTKFILEENSILELEPTDEGSKIHRTRFTAFQKIGLEEAFLLSKYVRSYDCQVIAARLGLTSKTVQIWFRNKRFKIRKIARQEKQHQRHPTTPSNSVYRNNKFQELLLHQTNHSSTSYQPPAVSSPPLYMYIGRSRLPSLVHPAVSPYFSPDDYLRAQCYSPSLTDMQSRFMHYQQHPYL